ncbi:hypothetical protein PEC18_18675 [Paucibacter sp. O1-1]|nr:hypothetical protein [Paucibacter sp. O1-1]MDA3827823.1 hypothetical protein [Paucibacter sp. O1-1]
MINDDENILSRNGEKHVDLRGPCPASTVAVLDAVSFARGRTRTDLVNEILADWVKAKAHEAMLVGRVLQGNPVPMERAGMASS